MSTLNYIFMLVFGFFLVLCSRLPKAWSWFISIFIIGASLMAAGYVLLLAHYW